MDLLADVLLNLWREKTFVRVQSGKCQVRFSEFPSLIFFFIKLSNENVMRVQVMLNNIHSVSFTSYPTQGHVGLEPIPAIIGQKGGVHLGQVIETNIDRVTFPSPSNLVSLINLTCMSLDRVRDCKLAQIAQNLSFNLENRTPQIDISRPDK